MPPKRAKTIATAAPTRRSTRTATAASTAASTSASVGKKRARSPIGDKVGDEEDDKASEAPPKKRAKAAKKSKAKHAKSDDDDQKPEDDTTPTKTTTKRVTRGTGESKAKGAKAKPDDAKDTTIADGDANDEAKKDDPQDDARDTPTTRSPSPPAKMVTVIKRGAAPVDPGSSCVNTHQVYAANGEVWDAMLNQTNVSKNNNKFYVIQLLHPIDQALANNIVMHTRWGRVGENGSSLQKGPWNAAGAIGAFKSQFKTKTSTKWEQRHSMTAQPGKYMWLERDYSDEDEHESEKKEKGKEKDEDEEEEEEAGLKASPEIQTLVQFIFNTTYTNAHLAEMNYDANKLPLGKLAKNTILAGFAVLKTLSDVINSPSGPTAQEHNGFEQACESLSNQYYSIIPHSFGRNRPIVINAEQLLKKELGVLDALGDMQIASKVLSDKSGPRIHPIDSHLASLQLRAIEPVEQSGKEFKALEKYVHDTHGATHSQYKVEVQNVFRIERDGERERWESAPWLQSEAGKNAERFLLWHGSRSTNFAGILKQGLRIAPPEAPVSGYMFGKGVYFADMMSKSANYCYASLSQNTGLLLLAEVAVAPFNDLIHAASDADAKCKANKKLATRGVGSVQPSGWGDCADLLGNDELEGVKMPTGPGVATQTAGSYLQYNEYIVYDVSQIRLRYLLKIKMQ